MKYIELDKLKLNSLTTEVKKSSEMLLPSTNKVSDITMCRGIMASEYVERVRKLDELIELYKQLLEKDIDDINKMSDKVVYLDEEIAKKLLNAMEKWYK